MEQQLLLPASQWRAVVPLIQSFTKPIPVSTSSSPAPCVWALAAILSLVLGCCHSGLGKPEGIVSTWGWFNYRESGLMGCSPLCAAMTPAHKAGDMPTAHECVLCIVLLLSDLCCATSYLENMGNRDHCTAFTLQYGRWFPPSFSAAGDGVRVDSSPARFADLFQCLQKLWCLTRLSYSDES